VGSTHGMKQEEFGPSKVQARTACVRPWRLAHLDSHINQLLEASLPASNPYIATEERQRGLCCEADEGCLVGDARQMQG